MSAAVRPTRAGQVGAGAGQAVAARGVAQRAHGGPDAAGPVRWDFSTNAHGAGPCPQALQAVSQADPSRYPDPAYHALRERLAAWHGVAPERVLFAASASEFIQRITAVGGRLRPGPVLLPVRAYGDYGDAARAWGRGRVVATAAPGEDLFAALGEGLVQPPGDGVIGTAAPADGAVTLRWCAEPCSPAGQDSPPPADPAHRPTVLDLAYAPLRLAGQPRWTAAARDAVFQLHSPNKALGLTGVRGAYVIAPADAAWPVDDWCAALAAAQPSWPLGAHAVAMLQAWTEPATQAWLADSLPSLRRWTADLHALLDDLGLTPIASVTPFMLARRPPAATAQALRARGLAVRDTTSFGLPGWMRLSAQPPEALVALGRALQAAAATGAGPGRTAHDPTARAAGPDSKPPSATPTP